MAHKCEYCGQSIEDNLEKCPNCGAVNSNYQRAAITQPKTIEELKLWYKQMNLPPEETTRFFIGKDHRAAKCYGIYQDPDTNKFVVYKFKADGTRAVRYEGDDEAYAVNEIFQKLREVIAVQKGMNAVPNYGKSSSGSYTSRKKKKSSFKPILITMVCVWMFGAFVTFGIALGGCMGGKHPERDRYYQYEDEYYYNFRGKYYRYDLDDDDWYYYGTDAPFDVDEYEDYEIDRGSYDVGNFQDSDVYHDWYDSQENNDSYDNDDSGWDSGWDSGDSWDSDYGSDWDSDW